MRKKNTNYPFSRFFTIYWQHLQLIHNTHPIDSLYTVESVKDTVPVIERILEQKMQDSGKYFACFVLSVSFLWHSFQLITSVHVLVPSYGHQTAKGVCGSQRESFVLDEICKKKIKFAAFSPLVLKSIIFEKKKICTEERNTSALSI